MKTMKTFYGCAVPDQFPDFNAYLHHLRFLIKEARRLKLSLKPEVRQQHQAALKALDRSKAFQRMTPSKLKEKCLENYPDSKFFTRSNMAFAGDTMGNFAVDQSPRLVRRTDSSGTPVRAYLLRRRRATRKGLSGGFYFSADDFRYLGPADHYTD